MTGSSLDRLRAQYREYVAKEQEQKLRVPVRRAAAGDLVVVYREPDWDVAQDIEKRWLASDDPRADLYQWAELCAAACVDIERRDDQGEMQPGFAQGEGDVSFHAAAHHLNLQAGDDPVQAVFAVLASDWEVQRHGRMVNAWEPQVASPEVEDKFVGESETTPGSTS